MRSRAAIVFGLLLGGSICRGEVVERVLAVVDQRPLLLSEVEALRNVKGISREEALEKAIDERLMYAEASRTPQSAVSPEEERRAYASLRARLPENWKGKVSEASLVALARREAVILKYVEFRFVPQIRIGDDAVRDAYLEETQGKPAQRTLEEAEGEIRQRLLSAELDTRIEAWVKELRDSAEIRYNPER